MRINRLIFTIIFVCLAFIFYENLTALSSGFVGLTKRNGNTEGCVCHSLSLDSSVKVSIIGPSSVLALDTVDYQIKLSGGPAIAGGIDIAADSGEVFTHPADTSLQRLMAEVMELTHRYPKLSVQDTITWLFRYVAPNTPGMSDTIFATGNSVNNDNDADTLDRWNFADNKVIQVNPISVQNNNTVVKNYELMQNYPNPFNPVTTISFNLRKSSNVSLTLYDINGKEISKLIVKKFYSPGSYSYLFDAGQYSSTSGVYFYRFMSEDFSVVRNSEVRKMVLIK